MTGEIIVKFPALRTAAEDIGATLRTMNSELDSLKATVAPMVSTWEGDAREAYFTRQSEWEKAAADITALLTQIQTAITNSADIMQAREAANANKFR